MAAATLPIPSRARSAARATSEPLLLKLLLTAIALAFLALFLVVPLLAVFVQALEKGFSAYAAALATESPTDSLRSTFVVACLSPSFIGIGL